MLAKSSINPKKIFIWDHDNPIESKKNKSWILFHKQSNIVEEWNNKKKLKNHKLKNKYIKFDM